jgi:biopolymer transport protein ExbD
MDDKEFNYINIIPMVDIMLVLLTIVLTTSTLVATGSIPLELPHAAKQHDELLHLQTIEIDRNGTIFLNSSPLCLASLRDAFEPIERSSPVLIRADKSIALQVFVDVIDVIKQLGFTKVSLQTEASS